MTQFFSLKDRMLHQYDTEAGAKKFAETGPKADVIQIRSLVNATPAEHLVLAADPLSVQVAIDAAVRAGAPAPAVPRAEPAIDALLAPPRLVKQAVVRLNTFFSTKSHLIISHVGNAHDNEVEVAGSIFYS